MSHKKKKLKPDPREWKRRWRIAPQTVNIFEGGRLVCRCKTEADARRIVEAVNATILPEEDPDFDG